MLTVRGTLSIKDAMTDITAIMQRLDEEDKSADIKGTHDHFVHTVQWIAKVFRAKSQKSKITVYYGVVSSLL